MNMEKEELKSLLLKHKMLVEDCWFWMRAITSAGYGKLYIKGTLYSVHRLSAYVFLDFDIKSKLFVLHKCDQRRCFNPDHLFVGTPQDNQDDFFNKGFKRRASNQYTKGKQCHG